MAPPAHTPADVNAAVDRPLLSRFVMEAATALILAAVGLAVVFEALAYKVGWDESGPQPGYFPFYVGLVIVGASVGILVQAFVVHRRTGEVFATREQAASVAKFLLPIIGCVVLTLLLGIYVATAVYLTAVMVVQGRYSWAFALLIGLGTSIAFFVLFELLFQQPLLKGPLENGG